MAKSSEKTTLNDMPDFSKPGGIPRIPRANHNPGWQQANLEVTDSGSRHALVTKDCTDNIAVRAVRGHFIQPGLKWALPAITEIHC